MKSYPRDLTVALLFATLALATIPGVVIGVYFFDQWGLSVGFRTIVVPALFVAYVLTLSVKKEALTPPQLAVLKRLQRLLKTVFFTVIVGLVLITVFFILWLL
jgi:predicted MFS family arabinose efflux permease